MDAGQQRRRSRRGAGSGRVGPRLIGMPRASTPSKSATKRASKALVRPQIDATAPTAVGELVARYADKFLQLQFTVEK
jgi:hypothetical protein